MKKVLKLAKKLSFLATAAAFAVLVFGGVKMVSASEESLQLTQTSATIGLNQRITFVSFNANQLTVSGGDKIVKANVSGRNQISIYGAKVGNTNLEICDDYFGCRTFAVKVQSTKLDLFKAFKTSVTVKAGEKITVPTSNGKNIVALSNNNSIAVAYAQNNDVFISGEKAGTVTVTVCSTNLGCVPIYAKVTGVKPSTVNPTTPVVTPNQNTGGTTNNNNGSDIALKLSAQNVYVSEGKSYEITANISNGLTAVSDSAAVRTAVNGNRITFYGTYIGSAAVKVCKPNKNCVAVSVTVTKPDSVYSWIGGDLRVSDSKIEVTAGQKVWVSVTGGTKYNVYTNNSYVASPKLYGNLVLITTSYAGKAVVSICSGEKGCVSVNVTTKASTQKKVTGTFRTIDQPKGTTKTYTFSFYNPTTYYIQNTTNNNLLSAALEPGNPFQLVVNTYDVGTSIITICPYVSSYNCGTVGINITEPTTVESKEKLRLSDDVITIGKGLSDIFTANIGTGLAAFSDNQSVRTAVNGNRITAYGVNLGAATVTVCSTNGTCDTIYVKVVEPSKL